MKKNNNQSPPTNFWFGFSLGTITAALTAYLLGTKNGRTTLKQIIELTENLPQKLDELNKKHAETKTNDPHPILPSPFKTLEKIVDKIRQNSKEKSEKKFFIKE